MVAPSDLILDILQLPLSPPTFHVDQLAAKQVRAFQGSNVNDLQSDAAIVPILVRIFLQIFVNPLDKFGQFFYITGPSKRGRGVPVLAHRRSRNFLNLSRRELD